MRTAKMTVDGREYLLCFSGRVIRNVTEKFGGMQEMYEALRSENQVSSLDAAVWVLAQMIQGGDRYAKFNGIDNPGGLTEDQLYDLFDIQDFAGIYGKIRETVNNGRTQTVSAKPGAGPGGRKNADATPGSN